MTREPVPPRHLVLLVPTLLAIAFVLSIYVDTPVGLPQAFRSVAVAIAVAVVAQATASLALRSASAGALIGAAIVMLLANWLVLLVIIGAAASWEWMRLRSELLGKGTVSPVMTVWPQITVVLTGAFLGSVVAIGIAVGAFGLPKEGTREPLALAAGDGPDTYVILLDAYARGDTLAAMGHDNDPFEAALEQRGFQVADASRSNYTQTGLTLSSMFNMATLDDIPGLSDPPEGYNQQHRLVSDTLHAGNPTLDLLAAAGYETFYLPSRVAQYAVEPVDHTLAGAELDNFELHVLNRTAVGWLLDRVAPGAIYDQQRRSTLATFASLRALAAKSSDRPRFAFAHLMAPHPPFIFDRAGALPPTPTCVSACTYFDPPGDPDERRARYIDQLVYTNQLVTETVDAIVAAEPDAIIVVMSDHGSRLVFSDYEESTHNFMAVRADRVDVPSDLTPISVFPRIFNAYLGTDIAMPDEESYASTEGTPWPLVELP